jgi:hypothetical protein
VPRWQALLALVAVSAGSVLLAAGPGGLVHVGTLVWGNIGWLLIGVGGTGLLLSVAPVGAVLGPLVLVAAGVAALGWPRPEIWALTGGVLVVGGAFVLFGHRPLNKNPMMRQSTLVFPWTLRLRAEEKCPDRLFVRTIGGRLTIDVTAARKPSRTVIELMVTCWGGWVQVDLPDHWAVVGGRLDATPLISLRGVLDSSKSYPDPGKLSPAEVLELTEPRRKEDRAPALLVVHVMGLGGGVRLSR